MKKKLLIALFIMAVVISVFASCGECEHASYKEVSRVEATCYQDGSVVSECEECGEQKTEVLTKTGVHSLEYEEVEPTCKVDGKIVSTCKVEGCTYTSETAGKKATGKCVGEVIIVTEATCTTNGLSKQVCTMCGGDVLVIGFNGVIPATGHTYDNAPIEDNAELGVTIVYPDCANDGYVARTCQTCQYDQDPITLAELKAMDGVESTFIEEMTKWGHNFEAFVETVDPTCMVQGYTTYKCVNPGCDETENRDSVKELGHDYVKGDSAVEGTHYVVTLQPTCIATGEKAYICQRCNEQATNAEDKEEIPMVEHNIADDDAHEMLSHFDADCLNPEKKTYKCNVDANCTKSEEYTYGEALGHDWQVSGEQTCKTEGKTPYACARTANGIKCEETKLDDPTNADIRHTQGATVSEPTCCTFAFYQCTICDEVYEAYEDDEAGRTLKEHAYTQFVSKIDPTCFAEGYSVYSCTAGECGLLWGDAEGEYDRDVTARIDHIFATITEDGRIVCTVAGCAHQYRDVTTESTDGNDNLCLGCEKDPCECNITVEWNGYVSPKAPFELVANEEKVISEIEWTVIEKKNVALAIGEGIIILKSETATKFTIKLYNAAGDELGSIVEEGADVQVDLYKYTDVAKVAITAEANATCALYSIVK